MMLHPAPLFLLVTSPAMMFVALVVLGAAPLGATLADAQSIPHITVQVDSDVYGPGETVHISGTVDSSHGGAVTIKVISPAGSVVAVGQTTPEDRDWSWQVPAEFAHPGTYTILAYYTLTADPDRRAAATFVYSTAVTGLVEVNGTIFNISYTGDPILSSWTDAESSLIHVVFEGPSNGVMRLPAGLVEGTLVAVSGGTITALPDGSYAYATDSSVLVMTADVVAVPEFGLVVLVLGAAAAASVVLPRLRQLP